MALIILSIIFTIVLFDFAIIGFIPNIFSIWPSLKDLTSDILIEDNVLYSIGTNIKNKYGSPIITSRINYKSIILTKKYLIIKNTYLTCLFFVFIRNIDSYSIEQGLYFKTLKFNLSVDDKKVFLKFKTKNSELWINSLRELKIKLRSLD